MSSARHQSAAGAFTCTCGDPRSSLCWIVGWIEASD
jgi:hypothetical protein